MTFKQLFDASGALDKIFAYKHWPASMRFYLSVNLERIWQPIVSFANAYNELLVQFGGTSETGSYTFEGETALAFQSEYTALGAQKVDVHIDPEHFCIDVTALDEWEKELPPDERLALSANDFAALKGIVEVRETRERTA